MVYTAYTKEEEETLPKFYKKKVVGVKEGKEILQVPLCPECGSSMMEVDEEYLSCVKCGAARKMRVLKE